MAKKLIIFSYDFPPSNGGIARLCQEIAVGQQKYFDEVIVLTRKKEGENKPYNFDKVKVVELSTKRFYCEREAFQFFKKLNNKENYIVLCGVWHPEAAISILAGMKNTFVLGHGTEFLSANNKFRKYIWLPIYSKWVLDKAKLVIANSSYTKKLVESITSGAKVVELPLGVNETFFTPLINEKVFSNGLRIATLSRILKFKGLDFIANAIAKLPSHLKDKIVWNVGGTGAYLNELKELVIQLGIEKNVIFHGFIPDDELPDFYNQNDIFVLCTRETSISNEVEGFGLVFLEAQSCGLPVIGTNTGGIPSAIDVNNGGWLIEQDNIEQLQEVLTNCILDKELIKNYSSKARNRVVESCTWSIYNETLNKLLAL